MVEYLYDCIRATAGEDITITAKISEEDGTAIIEGCSLVLFDDNEILVLVEGVYEENVWLFTIPADITEGLKGRCWYSVKYKDSSLCFAEPIYLV